MHVPVAITLSSRTAESAFKFAIVCCFAMLCPLEGIHDTLLPFISPSISIASFPLPQSFLSISFNMTCHDGFFKISLSTGMAISNVLFISRTLAAYCYSRCATLIFPFHLTTKVMVSGPKQTLKSVILHFEFSSFDHLDFTCLPFESHLVFVNT